MTPTVPDTSAQSDKLLRYNGGAVFLHWLTALLVLAQIYIGFTFHGMERGPARGDWFTWHKSVGVTILLLALVRLAWRLTHKPPPFPSELPRWERLAAVWNHRIFYVILIALPLGGLLAVSGGADEATTGLVGGLRFPLIPGISESLGDVAGEAHELLVKLTIALLVIHVAAALKHQFVDGKRVGRVAGRMPPFKPTDHSPTAPVD